MRIDNRHERLIAAPPERVAELIRDLDSVWPTELAPAPVPRQPGLYDAEPMLWQEVDRPGATRAFRVVAPAWLEAEHWFELEPGESGTVLRHTVAGEATGQYEDVWRRRIEPLHDRILEALLDNAEAAVGSGR